MKDNATQSFTLAFDVHRSLSSGLRFRVFGQRCPPQRRQKSRWIRERLTLHLVRVGTCGIRGAGVRIGFGDLEESG